MIIVTSSFKNDPWKQKRDLFFYMVLMKSKISDTKLLYEQEILADSLLLCHLYSVSGDTGGAQPPSTKPFWYKRTVCLALIYLNSSVLLPMMDLDVSVGQGWGGWGEDAAGELCCIFSGMAAKAMCPRAGWVTLQRAAVLHCCLKGKHFKSCSLCGSQTTIWWEREGTTSSGASCTLHQGFPACCHAAHMGQSHRETLQGWNQKVAPEIIL